MAIFPVRIPYSLQKPKNTYPRDFSLRVATLVEIEGVWYFLPFVLVGGEWIQILTEFPISSGNGKVSETSWDKY